jgi:hypothetical protein
LDVAKKLTKAQRQKVIDLFPSGKSCNQIAKETGRGKTTVHRIARDEGHQWGQSNLLRAHEARKWYCAESRAKIAARLEEEANLLLDDLHKPYVAFNFGGKDNDYNDHPFDEPPTEAKFTIMRSVQAAVRTVSDIVKVDNRGDDDTQTRIKEFRDSVEAGTAKDWEEEEPTCES